MFNDFLYGFPCGLLQDRQGWFVSREHLLVLRPLFPWKAGQLPPEQYWRFLIYISPGFPALSQTQTSNLPWFFPIKSAVFPTHLSSVILGLQGCSDAALTIRTWLGQGQQVLPSSTAADETSCPSPKLKNHSYCIVFPLIPWTGRSLILVSSFPPEFINELAVTFC